MPKKIPRRIIANIAKCCEKTDPSRQSRKRSVRRLIDANGAAGGSQ